MTARVFATFASPVWASILPARIMDNHEIERLVDTSDEWIRKRTGIVERRIAAPDETSCTMAVAASRGSRWRWPTSTLPSSI